MNFIRRMENLVSEGYTIYAAVGRSRPGGWFIRACYHDNEGNCDYIKANYVTRLLYQAHLSKAIKFVMHESP